MGDSSLASGSVNEWLLVIQLIEILRAFDSNLSMVQGLWVKNWPFLSITMIFIPQVSTCLKGALIHSPQSQRTLMR